jgi:hypothetical protein
MTKTEDLDYLLTLELPTIAFDGMSPAIRLSDVPQGLRPALDEFQFLAARPIVEGEICVFLHDWERFLRRHIMTLHAAMHGPSLKLGLEGPSPADLARAPVLSGWLIISSGDEARLIGTPAGHPTCTGKTMHSSPLCGLDSELRWARTISRWFALSNQVTAAQFVALHGPGAAIVSKGAISVEEALEIIADNRRRHS